MLRIDGYFYEKGRAARVSAVFSTNGMGRYAIELENATVHRGDLSHLHISERLGNVERKITLEDDSIFTTLNNDAIDSLFKHRQKTNTLVHYLETHMQWIIVALVVAVLTGFSFFKWGVPWASTQIAHALPYETNNLIAKGSMTFLDKYMFEESTLSEETQERIRRHFKEKLARISIKDDDAIKYTLHFRSWTMDDTEIPNALALPSGDMILTDKFIQIAANQDEIDSVILHEMGHVVHRHGLEMLIEGTFITVAVMMMTGDGSGMGDMGVGLGSALVSSAYSRGHESEADLYAFEKMLKVGINPKSFSNIMQRMTTYMTQDYSKEKKQTEDKKVLDYFSSHPSTQKRIDLANCYSDCFNQGLTTCK